MHYSEKGVKQIVTRFIYIADTHLGANPAGYQQQKAYPEKLPDILSALCKHVAKSGGQVAPNHIAYR